MSQTPSINQHLHPRTRTRINNRILAILPTSMRHRLFGLNYLIAASAAAAAIAASPGTREQITFNSFTETHEPRPLVIWHGLGDTALSDGILGFINSVKDIHPGIFVYSVKVPEDGSLDDERKAGFWGNAEEQGMQGCEQIENLPELRGGFDAIGFSQGGLFLRSYAQYCSTNGPPLRNLITFGTPHYGISALLPCPTPPTLSCLLAARAARAGIYRSWAQEHLIQAAYYRDVERLDEFYDVNTFLRDLNAEGIHRPTDSESDGHEHGQTLTSTLKGKEGGGNGLKDLQNLVAIQFDQDRTVSPLQSAHFGTYAPNNKTLLIPLPDQPLYKEDWIGLRNLDEKGGLQLIHCPGEHMDLGGEGGCGEMMIRDWVGWPKD